MYIFFYFVESIWSQLFRSIATFFLEKGNWAVCRKLVNDGRFLNQSLSLCVKVDGLVCARNCVSTFFFRQSPRVKAILLMSDSKCCVWFYSSFNTLKYQGSALFCKSHNKMSVCVFSLSRLWHHFLAVGSGTETRQQSVGPGTVSVCNVFNHVMSLNRPLSPSLSPHPWLPTITTPWVFLPLFPLRVYFVAPQPSALKKGLASLCSSATKFSTRRQRCERRCGGRGRGRGLACFFFWRRVDTHVTLACCPVKTGCSGQLLRTVGARWCAALARPPALTPLSLLCSPPTRQGLPPTQVQEENPRR